LTVVFNSDYLKSKPESAVKKMEQIIPAMRNYQLNIHCRTGRPILGANREKLQGTNNKNAYRQVKIIPEGS